MAHEAVLFPWWIGRLLNYDIVGLQQLGSSADTDLHTQYYIVYVEQIQYVDFIHGVLQTRQNSVAGP